MIREWDRVKIKDDNFAWYWLVVEKSEDGAYIKIDNLQEIIWFADHKLEKLNKYIILHMPWMWLLEEDIEIFGETPQKAYQKRFWKTISLANNKTGNVILWTWKKRQNYFINK